MVLSAPERMTRLIEVAAALSKTMTPEQVADVVTTMALAALGARAGAFLHLDDEAAAAVAKTVPPEQVADLVAPMALAALGVRVEEFPRPGDEADEYVLHEGV